MDYAKFATIATTLLTKFGRTATLSRKVSGTYVPGTSTAPVTTSASTVKIVMAAYPADMINGTSVHREDKQVAMAVENVTVTPQAGDKLTIGNVTYSVISVKDHTPADVPLIYELQVRR